MAPGEEAARQIAGIIGRKARKRGDVTIRFKSWTCNLVRRRYRNGRTALQLVDAEDGEPVANATVNLPEVDLAEDEVLVKDCSENEGMLAALTAAGAVEPTGRVVVSGFVTVPVCRLRDGI